MIITQNSFFHHRLLPLLLVLVFVAACGSKDNVAGNYQAEGKDSTGQVETVHRAQAQWRRRLEIRQRRNTFLLVHQGF